MNNSCASFRQFALVIGFSAVLIPGIVKAQAGSAMGDVSVSGDVSIVRDNAANPATDGDVVFHGDTITTQTSGEARVDLLEGGNVAVMGGSEAGFDPGQVTFGASGGGCFSELGVPFDVVVNGQTLASGVTSGGVFDGVFYSTCDEALAAATAGGGGGLSNTAKLLLGLATIAVGAEILDDDDPVHGN